MLHRLGLMAVVSAVALTVLVSAHAQEGAMEKSMMADESARQSPLAQHTLLLDYVTIGNRLLAVGEFGNIVYSDDAGKTWTQARVVATRTTLTSVYFVDQQLGFAVGHDTAIVRTRDGGATWDLIYKDDSGELPLFGVHFTDARRGIAVGAFGTVMRTQDGGATWAMAQIDPAGESDFHLNDIFAARDGYLYVPAEAGGIYRSRDKGRTFRLVKTAYEGSFWGGMGLASGRVLIWGMRGNVFYSDNKGLAWKPAKTATDRSVVGGVQLANGRIVLTGLSGLVLDSRDNGRTFTETVRDDRRSYAAVSMGADGRLILYGDPGVNWQDLP